MTQKETDKRLTEEILKRERETPTVTTGIPGVCIAGVAAPDCIVVVQWIGELQIPYCLN